VKEYVLNLGFENDQIYRGSARTFLGDGRVRMETHLVSALVIASANMTELLKKIPKSERGKLVLTGAVPPSFFLAAQSIIGSHFKEVEHFDGNKKVRYKIPPPPPASFQSEPV